jgi:hypothetical protein
MKPLIGTGFLEKRYNSIAFDFKTHTMWLQEKPNAQDKNISYGFGPVISGSYMLVGSKMLNFSAELDKINLGDTIYQLNQVPATNPCAVLYEFERARANNETVHLSINKNKQITTLDVLPKPVGQ